VIIGESFASPRFEAEANWGFEPKQAELPQLQRVSDIMMAYWLRGNPDPKNLKYYLVCNILNEQTVRLINAVLKNKGLDKIPYWPGVVANMWEEEGPALLGKWSWLFPERPSRKQLETVALMRLHTTCQGL